MSQMKRLHDLEMFLITDHNHHLYRLCSNPKSDEHCAEHLAGFQFRSAIMTISVNYTVTVGVYVIHSSLL